MKTKIIIAAILGLTILPMSCRTKNEKKTTIVKEQTNKEEKKMNVKELTLESFKNSIMDYEANPNEWKFKGERPAVIDFYAVWCGPCKATAPILESLAKEYDGQVDFYKVDIDKQQELSTMFDIRSIPTLLFIPKEGKPQMQVGAMDHTQLENAIKSILQK
ncbi:thioredoxin [Segatella albensis]|jgi:thioredoxin|uniref:thioredoxin n=1 Tax=Segatella albensis TaxID=77768 RepID=UPI000414B4D3